MIRAQIQLTEDQARILKALAAKRKSSVAELIRQSVDNLIRETSEVDMAERRQRAIAAAGRFHSGRTDISTHHDDYLTEAYQT